MAPEVVGFVGLGSMGQPMARSLQEKLSNSPENPDGRRSLHVNNRSQAKAESLLNTGATWCDSPADVAGKCSVTFSMLADDTALREVFDSYLSGSPKSGSVFADCSTVYPATTQELAAAAKERGVIYLSCPVFGRPDAAAAKRLVNVMSGPVEGKERVRPYLEAMGRAVIDVGNDPRLGSAMKLVGNSSIVSAIECISEAMTLADKNGLARDDILQFFSLMFPGQVYEGYAKKIASDSFEVSDESPGFPVKLGIKDAGHMQQLAAESKVPMPVVDAALSNLKLAESKGRGGLDWSAIATVLRDQAM